VGKGASRAVPTKMPIGPMVGTLSLCPPKPDESLKFFVDVMGMTVSGRKGESVYLRGWDDYAGRVHRRCRAASVSNNEINQLCIAASSAESRVFWRASAGGA
jgi:catechol 2,3-dioxygenase-like lactoylglutathione lyase family enzyme